MRHRVYQCGHTNFREKKKNTLWTNKMDHYLSRILVEHVHKGYKLDKIIIKPATYAAAVVSLNENFGLELTKDHIKNRLKTWKKQYSVLREMLAEKGFRWDKKQRMVVAKDAVWNNYIKEHPDAKVLRAKLIDNYDELCIIFGNHQAVASCSDDGAEVEADLVFDCDSDDEAADIAIESEIRGVDRLAKNLRWTEQMDAFLGMVLVEQVQKGYKMDNILQRDAYDAAFMALNEKFGPDIAKEHVKNRVRIWKKQYAVLKDILSHRGFKWDEKQQMILGNDLAWNDYIKAHPDAQLYKGRVIENYGQLCTIFGHNHAVESYYKTADDVLNSLAGESDGMEPIDASPIQAWAAVKDQAKNMRWTNEMDSCLSMILVEQVKQRNKSKLESKFQTAAYVAAVSALNEKFHLDLTKDHIKNRIKTWQKVYNNVKELLEQGEFKWDKKRKMVIADDFVWQKYIKLNPDVRLLHGRVIGYYDDLCVIFGNDYPNENSCIDADADSEWAGENVQNAEIAYPSQCYDAMERENYVMWIDDMDRCLIEKLAEQVKLGNKADKDFNPVAYEACLSALNENFSLDLTIENLRSRLNTWKKLYILVKELLCNKGFEWDKKQKMVVANNSIWNEYTKTHSEALFLRGRSIWNYDKLHIIFGNDDVIGCWSVSSGKSDLNPGFNNEYPVGTPQVKIAIEAMSQENTCDDTQGSSQRARSRPSSSSRSKQFSKKRRASCAMVEMMSEMAANIGKIADALTASNQASLDVVFEMVQNIPGFDDDLIIEACEFLSFDEKRARMFLKLDERLRKMWLLKRLRGHWSGYRVPY